MTEPDPEEIERRLSERLDDVIAEILEEYGGAFTFGVPLHWVLIIGHQEASGEKSAVSYLSRYNQPFYVSLGLVKYESAALDGIAMGVVDQ